MAGFPPISVRQPQPHDIVDDPVGVQYTVEFGDTLSSIAQQFYGDPEQWRRVFRANGNQIDDPEQIFPGQVLRIPQ
jgi:nucleoid-associated protein YgaU